MNHRTSCGEVVGGSGTSCRNHQGVSCDEAVVVVKGLRNYHHQRKGLSHGGDGAGELELGSRYWKHHQQTGLSREAVAVLALVAAGKELAEVKAKG